VVVNSEEEAGRMRLRVDHDDTLAMRPGDDFALLIHGAQPAGPEAARAVARLRAEGWSGYGRRAPLPVAGAR
jgi:hypothetical protein